MAYVTVPKDLTHVKSKVLFGLTKRQLVCFGGALLTGGPLYFLTRNYLSNSAAALLMIFAMLPGLLFALFERHGQPLEVVIQQMIQCCFLRPKVLKLLQRELKEMLIFILLTDIFPACLKAKNYCYAKRI